MWRYSWRTGLCPTQRGLAPRSSSCASGMRRRKKAKGGAHPGPACPDRRDALLPGMAGADGLPGRQARRYRPRSGPVDRSDGDQLLTQARAASTPATHYTRRNLMNRTFLVIVLVTCLALGLSACVPAPAPVPAATPMPAPAAVSPTPDTAARIANAMSAAPMAVARDATIIDWPAKEGGPMVVLRQGTNNWTCVTDWPVSPGNDPQCNDPMWTIWSDASRPAKCRRSPGLGIAYMLAGGSDPSNTDPMAMAPAPGAAWITPQRTSCCSCQEASTQSSSPPTMLRDNHTSCGTARLTNT